MKAVLLRDLLLAFRTGGGFGLGVAFLLIIVVLVPLAVGRDAQLLAAIGPGMLWIGALLATLLSLDRIFALDAEDGSLALLAQAPLPLEALVFAKALAHWLTTALPLVLVAPLFAGLLGLNLEAGLACALTLILGTPGLSAIGTFGAALTLGIKRGGLLMALLVLPLYLPSLIFGATALKSMADGSPATSALMMLAGISFASVALMPFASSAVLRIALR